MPKNSSAARRQEVRALAAAHGISYTAALRLLQAAASGTRAPGRIQDGGEPPSRVIAVVLFEQHRRRPAEVQACQVCCHVYLGHYDSPEGRGCVGCEESGVSCPVFVPSGPPELSAHADPVAAYPAAPCPWLCGHGLDEHGDGCGCFRCGCRYSTAGAAIPASVRYHGYPADGPEGRIVVIEAPAGSPVSLLPQVSPSEFAWGYGGGGPRELAHSLLVAALGPAAICPGCHGTAKTVLAGGVQVPYEPGSENEPDPETIMPCPLCEDGYRVFPCQRFKREIVAAWERDTEWVLDREQITAWLRTASPDLAAAAASCPAGG